MKKKARSSVYSRFINGTRGVVSLFLAILMVPFVSIAGALINAGRINSAVAIFDEALCNASNSTLGTYDTFLRSRFGLMAMSQDTSKWGSAYGTVRSSYSADDLINDVFAYYMQKNLEVLSNTYTTEPSDIEAMGIYPLSNTSVLLSSVLQTSKIAIPMKLGIDWLSLDDLVKSLTSGLNVLSSICSMGTSAANVGTDIKDLTQKQEKLEKAIQDCDDKKTEYTDAYTEFRNAVNALNTLVDQIAAAQSKLSQAQRTANAYAIQINAIAERIREIDQRIEELSRDGDDGGKPVDHTEEIEELEEEREEWQEDYDELYPGYRSSQVAVSSAQSELNGYTGQFPGAVSRVETAKSAYVTKIIALRDAVETSGNAAVGFQSAAKSLLDDSVDTVVNTISTGFTLAQEQNSKTIKDLKNQNESYRYEQTLAGYEDLSEYENHYYQMIQENDSAIRDLQNDSISKSNTDQMIQMGKNAAKAAGSELEQFAARDLTAEYAAVYSSLNSLAATISAVSVPGGYTKIQQGSSVWYVTVTYPVSSSYPQELIDNLEESITKDAGWAVLKAMLSFISALFKIGLFYNVDLKNTVDASSFPSGLPSASDHPLEYAYSQEDAAQSDYYKSLIDSFSSEATYEESAVGNAESFAGTLQSTIDSLLDAFEDFKLRKLPDIVSSGGILLNLLLSNNLGDTLSAVITTGWQKLLLTGYVSYNTANRTTYTGSALLGGSYGLPAASEHSKVAFSGAETEYIFKGSLVESENQKSVFFSVLFVRALLDIAPVVGDTFIATLAANVAAATFGLLGFLVYVLAIILEGFVDTALLVNGGTIPMLKSFVYITPAGIPRLASSILGLKLKDATQQTLYEKSADLAYDMNKSLEDKMPEGKKWTPYEPERYDDMKKNQPSNSSKFTDSLSWDYTKILQLLILVFRSTNHILKRLSDLIQMEGSYQAGKGIAAYGFDLNKSYTFLRASGSFTGNEFIRLSTNSVLRSPNRVVFKGY